MVVHKLLILWSSSVKYKLIKRVHSVKLYCKFVKYLGMTMPSERNAIQNSTHRSGHNLFMWSVQEFLLSFSIVIHQINILTKTYLLYEKLQDSFTSVWRTHCHFHHYQGFYSHVSPLAALVATLLPMMRHPSSLKQDQGPIWARTNNISPYVFINTQLYNLYTSQRYYSDCHKLIHAWHHYVHISHIKFYPMTAKVGNTDKNS